MIPTGIINGFKVYGFQSQQEFVTFSLTHSGILIALNAEKLYHGNETLREISKNGIGYTDGIGAVLSLKRAGIGNAIRLPGSELWLKLIEEASCQKKSIFLIGSSHAVVTEVVHKLTLEFPEIKIAGFRDGYLDEDDIVALIKKLEETQPDIVFVAQGSPRQEKLMKRLQQSQTALYMGLGGSFDVYVGKVRRAPKFFRNTGLEWFYRLLSQPARIKRQWVLIPFLLNLALNKYSAD